VVLHVIITRSQHRVVSGFVSSPKMGKVNHKWRLATAPVITPFAVCRRKTSRPFDKSLPTRGFLRRRPPVLLVKKYISVTACSIVHTGCFARSHSTARARARARTTHYMISGAAAESSVTLLWSNWTRLVTPRIYYSSLAPTHPSAAAAAGLSIYFGAITTRR
jgi:hypothetical protein